MTDSAFNKQRKERLDDSVCEYLEDDNIEVFWADLNQCINGWICHHRQQLDKALLMKKMVGGHRPLQIQQDFETQTSLLKKKLP